MERRRAEGSQLQSGQRFGFAAEGERAERAATATLAASLPEFMCCTAAVNSTARIYVLHGARMFVYCETLNILRLKDAVEVYIAVLDDKSSSSSLIWHCITGSLTADGAASVLILVLVL